MVDAGVFVFHTTTFKFPADCSGRFVLKHHNMNTKLLFAGTALCGICSAAMAQDLKTSEVPANVKSALLKQYPASKKVSWEKEHGNYEANWGGHSGEDSSATFSPTGAFIEIVVAIPVKQLPANAVAYVKTNYTGTTIKEAGRVMDAKGTLTYEVEIKGKDLIFDAKGNFIKED